MNGIQRLDMQQMRRALLTRRFKAATFVAPIPYADQVRVLTVQRGLPLWFDVHDPSPGWWMVQPHQYADAQIVRPVNMLSRSVALHGLPMNSYIAICRIYGQRMLAVSIEDSPYIYNVQIVSGELEPFTVFVAYRIDNWLIYGNTCSALHSEEWAEKCRAAMETGDSPDAPEPMKRALFFAKQYSGELPNNLITPNEHLDTVGICHNVHDSQKSFLDIVNMMDYARKLEQAPES